MKKFLGTLVCSIVGIAGFAQYSVKGKITNAAGVSIEGATITLSQQQSSLSRSVASDEGGSFAITVSKKGSYQISAGHVGMRSATKNIEVRDAETIVEFQLEQGIFFLDPLEIRSIRAAEKAPFTKTNISKDFIEKNNLGQDLPFLLNQTPSVVVNSDAGNGLGYTGIRIRGSDATRINVTMNGIPYNDAESQGTFFVDLPDIASSLNAIQIQRGVGTSSNGAGAFGATINMSTNEFIDSNYIELNNSIGSFNTWKHSIKAGTGLINKHFTVDARLSKLSSDGFIDRASSDLRSLYLSTAYTSQRSSVRFNLITGTEKTYQAWNGIPEALLATNRTYNSAGTEKPGEPYDNETDNYQQDHYQLFFNHSINDKWSFNTTSFLSKGRGYYEQYKADAKFASYNLPDAVVGSSTINKTDLIRQLWLDNNFYGQLFSFQYKKNKNLITFGGGWNQYDGRHFGEIIWAEIGVPNNHRWYNLNAFKSDRNAYVKWQHDLNNRWQLFADVQQRHVDYQINGFRNNPAVTVSRPFNFSNPKAGITYTNKGWQAYMSYAVANKEPNRDDFEAAPEDQPEHETLHDLELGISKRKSNISYGATAYYMLYNNQLVLTGKINDVGAYTRTNIANSYRLGIELQASAAPLNWLQVAGNISFSENKIKDGLEYVDDYDNGGQKIINHKNPTISFSPSVVGGATITFLPARNFELSLLSKYVSRQFLDNTENVSRSLQPYYVQDLRIIYALKNSLFKEAKVIGQVNNLFNKKYEPNGYTFSYIYNGMTTTENFYYPMAGTNVMVGVNINF